MCILTLSSEKILFVAKKMSPALNNLLKTVKYIKIRRVNSKQVWNTAQTDVWKTFNIYGSRWLSNDNFQKSVYELRDDLVWNHLWMIKLLLGLNIHQIKSFETSTTMNQFICHYRKSFMLTKKFGRYFINDDNLITKSKELLIEKLEVVINFTSHFFVYFLTLLLFS